MIHSGQPVGGVPLKPAPTDSLNPRALTTYFRRNPALGLGADSSWHFRWPRAQILFFCHSMSSFSRIAVVEVGSPESISDEEDRRDVGGHESSGEHSEESKYCLLLPLPYAPEELHQYQ